MMISDIKKAWCKAAYCSGTCRVSSSLIGACKNNATLGAHLNPAADSQQFRVTPKLTARRRDEPLGQALHRGALSSPVESSTGLQVQHQSRRPRPHPAFPIPTPHFQFTHQKGLRGGKAEAQGLWEEVLLDDVHQSSGYLEWLWSFSRE